MIASDVPPRPHERCGCRACCNAVRASYAPAPDWPIDSANGRLLCTPERPMPSGVQGQWAHSDIESLGDGDYIASYKCRTCGAYWTEELPE